MGLKIHSLAEIPTHEKRDYYIYVLDNCWHEPLGNALRNNFDKLASIAAKNNAAVIMGLKESHFNDEVLSWQNINGENAEKLLPAIMISTIYPENFEKYANNEEEADIDYANEKMLLIPLKKFCSTTTEVIELIQNIFTDIGKSKPLLEFEISKELEAGKGKAASDAIILQPNFMGVGVDLRKAFRNLKNK